MNVVFMGTPEFAVGCLNLLNKNQNVVGVFTQPDKPKGRKYVLTPPPVKETAVKLGLPVFQPKSVKDGKALDILKELNPDLIVVVAYGKILPKEILDLPKYGCINIHASLLPRHRGASPIQWCIVCGDRKTGVTSMKMDEGMDTGDMLVSKSIDIKENETAGELHDRLALLGADVLEETLEKLENGTLKREKQPESGVTYAPIIKKEMAKINFNSGAEEVKNAVRGYNPWPCAYFMLNGKRIKVYSVSVVEGTGKPGAVIRSDDKLIIACSDGAVECLEVQPEGSKRMKACDMLRGRAIEKGTIID